MANGKIRFGKQSGGTLGLVFPDGVGDTEVVLPESGELVTKDYADLKVALTAFTGANQSKSQSGYQKLPGGLIIQWGVASSGSDGLATLTLPVAFPAAQIFSIATATGSGISVRSIISASGTNTTTRAFLSNSTTGAAINGGGVAFLVIGY